MPATVSLLCHRCEVFAATPSCGVQSESGLNTSESPRKVNPRASLPARRASSAKGSVVVAGVRPVVTHRALPV